MPRLIADVGLAQQVLPQEVLDRPGDGRLLIGPLLLLDRLLALLGLRLPGRLLLIALGRRPLTLAVDDPQPAG